MTEYNARKLVPSSLMLIFYQLFQVSSLLYYFFFIRFLLLLVKCVEALWCLCIYFVCICIYIQWECKWYIYENMWILDDVCNISVCVSACANVCKYANYFCSHRPSLFFSTHFLSTFLFFCCCLVFVPSKKDKWQASCSHVCLPASLNLIFIIASIDISTASKVYMFTRFQNTDSYWYDGICSAALISNDNNFFFSNSFRFVLNVMFALKFLVCQFLNCHTFCFLHSIPFWFYASYLYFHIFRKHIHTFFRLSLTLLSLSL